MEVAAWALIVGGLLVLMALSGSTLKHLPLSTAMLYLPVGLAIGPLWLGLARFDPIADAKLLEHLTEFVVVVSLFSVGLKLSVELDDRRWLLPLRLAVGSMVLTVGLIALAGLALGLPLGAAVLLGAILAPTDPVLASDVQVSDPEDRSRLRVALTGEGGLNDGTAFPFVMLGLGLLGLHPLGEWGVRWFMVDVVWAVCGGLAIGGALGTLMGRLVLHLRMRHAQAVGYDDFLALGLIALSYGAALLVSHLRFPGGLCRRCGAAPGRAPRDARQPTRARRAHAGFRDARRAGTLSALPPAMEADHGRHPSCACAGIHGACHAGIDRADRTHRRSRGGRAAGCDAVGRRLVARQLVVRTPALPRDPPAGGCHRARGQPHAPAPSGG